MFDAKNFSISFSDHRCRVCREVSATRLDQVNRYGEEEPACDGCHSRSHFWHENGPRDLLAM